MAPKKRPLPTSPHPSPEDANRRMMTSNLPWREDRAASAPVPKRSRPPVPKVRAARLITPMPTTAQHAGQPWRQGSRPMPCLPVSHFAELERERDANTTLADANRPPPPPQPVRGNPLAMASGPSTSSSYNDSSDNPWERFEGCRKYCSGAARCRVIRWHTIQSSTFPAILTDRLLRYLEIQTMRSDVMVGALFL